MLTSAPQPVGAVLAFLVVEHMRGLLPASFAFAAGAMLALVAFELVPQAFGQSRSLGASAGSLAGAAVMVALAVSVGVYQGRVLRHGLRTFRTTCAARHRWRSSAISPKCDS